MKIRSGVWQWLTAVKWLMISASLPTFKLPSPPIYSSILLLVAMFGPFALEYGTGIHWKTIDCMRQQINPRWYILNTLLSILGVISFVVLMLSRNSIEGLPIDIRRLVIYSPLLLVAVWWISYMALTDCTLNQWYKKPNTV